MTNQEKSKLNHVAIIMDGNRRWANQKNLPGMFGHKEGVKALKKITTHCDDISIKYLTVYAFSTENWNRKKEEVDFLMSLLQESLKAEIEEMHSKNIKIQFIGLYKDLPGSLPALLESAVDKTKNNTGLNFQVAINYGSRLEIATALKTIANKIKLGELDVNDISEDLISSYLFTAHIPDPDLVIRTGGEFRISNYLLWQSAYSEFYSTETLWPDFSPNSLDEAILEFNKRQRRFGV